MSRKDLLASGDARSVSYTGGFGEGTMKSNLAEEGSIPETVDNSALFAPKAPTVVYRGQPFNKRVLVRPVEMKSNSAIIIPDSAKANSEVGIIVSFSVDSELKKQGMTEGTMVLFDKFAAVGQQFPLINEQGESESFLLLQEFDIQLQLIPYSPKSDDKRVQ